MSGELDFKMVANNDHAVDCYIRRSNNKLPFNLTGCRVLWMMFENGVPVVTKDSVAGASEIMIFDQSLEVNVGRLRLFLVPDDTKDLQTDEHKKHEFLILDSNNKVLNVSEDDDLLTVGQVWLRRQFTVKPAVATALLESFETFDLNTMTGDFPGVVWEQYEYPSGVDNGETDQLDVSLSVSGATDGDKAIRLQYEVIDTVHGGGFFSFGTTYATRFDVSAYSSLLIDITVDEIASGDRIWFSIGGAEQGKGTGAPGVKAGTPTGQTGLFTIEYIIDPDDTALNANAVFYIENDEGYLNVTGDKYNIVIDRIRGVLA